MRLKMSLFGKLFGKKKEEITAQDAINQLHDTEAILIKKQEYYENKIEEEIATAKKYNKTNQRMALNALKRKKQYEILLERIDGTLSKLEAQRSALEDAGTNAEVLRVLAESTKTLKKAHLNLDLDKVNDLMDDIADQMADSKEINEAISRPIGDVADDDELIDELKELEEEAARERAKEEAPQPTTAEEAMEALDELPEAPRSPLARKPKVQKQDTMAELEAWAAAN